MKISLEKNKNSKNIPLDTQKLEFIFILTICLITTFIILIFAHPNSLTNSDECTYLNLGKQIVEEGHYGYGFPDGRPIIPSIIALFLYLGFDIVTVRAIIPIIFMNSVLIATYALGKTLFGRKEAFVATLFLFTFPFFWEIGNTTLVDIPLLTFTTLFLLFFYLGIEKETKYLYISAILISIALLVKMTAILFVFSAFFYLIIKKRLDICRNKDFIISAMIVPLLFFSVYTLFHVFMSASINISNIERATVIHFYPFEILRLGLAPILVLAVFGISKERRSIYLCLPILTFFLFWSIQGRFFDLRQFASLLPLVGIFIGVGFFNLLNKYNKKVVCVILIVLLATSFVNAIYLNDYHNETNWGITSLSNSINELKGTGKVAVDSYEVTCYLRASTNKDIIGALEYAGKYPHARPTYTMITNEWLCENNVDYIVLSIYGERYRSKFEDCIHPKFLMIEIPFMEVGQCGQLPQSVCEFKSDFYNECEKNYEKVEVICKDEQEVFRIYKK